VILLKELIITINEVGEVELDAQGYLGLECENDILKLKQALLSLGFKIHILSQKKKPEYYRKSSAVKTTR